MKQPRKWLRNTRASHLELKSRARRDIRKLLAFIERQPWGNRDARKRDIDTCLRTIRYTPIDSRVEAYRGEGIELRRRKAAPFIVIYAYLPPTPKYPHGIVSIRAVRHRRERHLFQGVRDEIMLSTSRFAGLKCWTSRGRAPRLPLLLT